MPYPGLRPFEEKDHAIFFGREVQVFEMLRQLEDRRFLAVVGSSGCGKSSLVKAGLLAAIRRGFLRGTKNWFVLPAMKPGHDPYRGLAAGLAQCIATEDSTQRDPSQTRTTEEPIIETLQETDKGLLDALTELEIAPGSRKILIVDQFEELFAFRWSKPGRERVAPRNDAASFVRMLLRSCSDPNERVWVVLTMRSDFIGNCEAFLGLPEAVSRGQFLVPRLDRKQMEEAIVRPGEVRTAGFQAFTFQQDLVNRIINDAGDRPDQLPMMQHALMRTWKRALNQSPNDGKLVLTHQDYENAGQIAEALDKDAEEAWDKIKSDTKKAQLARHLFLQLCDVSPDGQITRRRPRVSEVMAVTGATVREVEEVVREFQADDRNFLLPPPDESLTPDTYIDISHEALLRQWRRFSEWLERERTAVAELRRLVQSAELHRETTGALLQAKDLDRVRLWQKDNLPSGEWAKRYVTSDEWNQAQSFIEKSAEEEERRQETEKKKEKQWAFLKLALLLTLVIATGISVFFLVVARNNATQAKLAAKTAQRALTDTFFRTIGISKQNVPMRDERETLWELAQLDRANASVRAALLNRWFGTADAFMRGNARGGQGFRSARGLNIEYHRLAKSNATDLGRLLATALQNLQETDSSRLSTLSQALAALADLMEPQAAAEIAKDLAAALENPMETNSDRLSSLGNALGALANKMEPQPALELAKGLATALKNPQETDSSRLSSLGQTVAALIKNIQPPAAAEIANDCAQRLAVALKNPQDGQALAVLTKKIQPQAAAEIAKVVAAALENPGETDTDQLSILVQTLAALADAIEPKAAEEIAIALAAALENPEETDTDRLSSLAQALAALADAIEPQAAEEIAKGLAAALELPDETDRPSRLGQALAALTKKIQPQAAEEIAKGLAAALENPEETDTDRLSSLAQTLAALTRKIQPQAAAEIGKDLAATLENPKETNTDRVLSLGQALEALANKMEPQDAAVIKERASLRLESLYKSFGDRLSLIVMLAALETRPPAAAEIAMALAELLERPGGAPDWRLRIRDAIEAAADSMEQPAVEEFTEHFAAALGNRSETDSNQLLTHVQTLAMLTKKLQPQAAAEIAKGLAAALENREETDPNRLSSLGNALAALANKSEPQAAAEIAKDLAAALENPMETNSDRLSSLGNALGALANKMEPQAATKIAKGFAATLENPEETNDNRLLSLGQALAVLADKMQSRAATEIAEQGAWRLAAALEKRQETDSSRLSSLGSALATFCRFLPSARHTQLLALSNMLLQPVPKKVSEGKERSDDRKLLADVCAQLHTDDLAEILKYPFCTGEAEQIVLDQLKAKTQRDFGGDVWKFVEQSDSLGIKDVDTPARRPSASDALKELKAL
jgi:hypothetical protein